MSPALRVPVLALSRRVQFKGKARLLDYFRIGPSNVDLVPAGVTSVRCIHDITISTTNNRDYLFRELYVHGSYQDDVLVALENLLRPGDVFWDIGANYGFMSLYVSKLFNGKVKTVAFEPNRVIVSELQRNVDLNDCGASIRVEPTCLSDRVGTATFHVSRDNAANASLISEFAAEHGQDIAVEVPTTTIDETVKHLPPPSVIKLDVEGGEHLVVAGGESYLSRMTPPIVAEYNVKSIRAAGLSPTSYLDIYRRLGYDVYMLKRPWFGLHRWEGLHPIAGPAEIPPLCNLVLLNPDSALAGSPRTEVRSLDRS